VRESEFVISEAANFAELEQVVVSDDPDLSMIDLHLPPLGGIAAVERLIGRSSTRHILWSLEPSHSTVLAAIARGASGYVGKDISSAGLVRALRGALNGEAPLSRRQTAELVGSVHGFEERNRALERANVLSPREREVLALVSQGARNRQIAEALSISEFTVKRHMQNILTKLQLPSRSAAGMFYRAAFESADGRVPVGAEA
jgi:two-component system, NarL family, nitrate/nitrite response regulator NarL